MVLECVSCGKEIELSRYGRSKHKCSKRHESARRAAANRDFSVRSPSLEERLQLGFLLLQEDEWVDRVYSA